MDDLFQTKKEMQVSTSHFFSQHARFFYSLFYTLASLFVFYLLICVVGNYILRLKVETAVVSTSIEEIISPIQGSISQVFASKNQLVKRGTPLIRITNLELERKLALAQIQEQEARLKIEYFQQLLDNEKKRLAIYQKIGSNRVESAQSAVNIAIHKVEISEKNLERFAQLYKKQFISKANWELMRAKHQNALENLKNAKALQSVENHSLAAVHQGMYFTGSKTEGIEKDLYAAMNNAIKLARVSHNKVQVYKKLASHLIIRAPFDGIVRQCLKSVGTTTDAVKPIMLIENIAIDKTIVAFLTQNEITHLKSNQAVKIYVPFLKKIYRGKVIEINRTDGFIDEIKSQYRWRDLQFDRSALVVIQVNPESQQSFTAQVAAGTPDRTYKMTNRFSICGRVGKDTTCRAHQRLASGHRLIL